MNLNSQLLPSIMPMKLIWYPIYSRKLMVRPSISKFVNPLSHFDVGNTPGIALFATNARYKREAYRGSEFAPRILSDHGFHVAMKVCHGPYTIDAFHLLHPE